jgi:hypothetical protein
MREIITSITEIIGAGLIALGVGFIFGKGAAFVVAGIFVIVGSYLAGNNQ